jgi:hypothetical protein
VTNYVKCIEDDIYGLTKNKVYKVLKENNEHYRVLNNNLVGFSYFKYRFVKAYSLKDRLNLIKELLK